jgi:DNA repair exonuclease SbcCD ATPase subunit
MDMFHALVWELEKWQCKIDKSKDIFEQIENINQRLQNLKTQIETIEVELKKDDNNESQSIESQLISVSRILELKYKLDAKDITVAEWVEYQKQAEKTIKQQKANGK